MGWISCFISKFQEGNCMTVVYLISSFFVNIVFLTRSFQISWWNMDWKKLLFGSRLMPYHQHSCFNKLFQPRETSLPRGDLAARNRWDWDYNMSIFWFLFILFIYGPLQLPSFKADIFIFLISDFKFKKKNYVFPTDRRWHSIRQGVMWTGR